MKISFLLAYLIIGCAHFLAAQTAGIRTGLNVASQVWKADGITVHPGSVSGYHFGFTLNFGESEKISGQLEASISQFGFGEYSDSSGTIGPKKLNYLKIGCAIKYHLKENINFHIGPELGFSADNLKQLALPDFGAFVGIEYYFTSTLGIGGRYFLGFSDINDNPELKQFNRAFQISILVRFNGQQLKEMGY